MRFVKICVSVLFLLAAASAADFTIKVVDPQSAAVAGAQVDLFRRRFLDSGRHGDHFR